MQPKSWACGVLGVWGSSVPSVARLLLNTCGGRGCPNGAAVREEAVARLLHPGLVIDERWLRLRPNWGISQPHEAGHQIRAEPLFQLPEISTSTTAAPV